MPSKSQPLRQGLLFFSDHLTEVLRSWNKPFFTRLFSPVDSNHGIMGLNKHGYGAMPRVEGTLASYLSPETASSLKAL